MQNKIKQFNAKHNYTLSPICRILDISSELGEVSKEFLKAYDYDIQKASLSNNAFPELVRLRIKDELGDLLYSVISLANEVDIDIEQAINESLIKYEKRLSNEQ